MSPHCVDNMAVLHPGLDRRRRWVWRRWGRPAPPGGQSSKRKTMPLTMLPLWRDVVNQRSRRRCFSQPVSGHPQRYGLWSAKFCRACTTRNRVTATACLNCFWRRLNSFKLWRIVNCIRRHGWGWKWTKIHRESKKTVPLYIRS